MHINAHCHVFSLGAVATPATRETIRNRLVGTILSSEIQDSIMDWIDGLLAKSYAAPRPRGGVTDKRNLAKLREEFDVLAKRYGPDDDAQYTTIDDFRDTLHLITTDTDHITDNLMAQMGLDDIATPLMMDITTESDDDAAAFQGQIEDHERQVRRYPGRILPFMTFNPRRTVNTRRTKDGLAIMREVLGAPECAFVGLKVYPSLGYPVPDLGPALGWCAQNGFPVMTHCTPGGFKRDDAAAKYCEPVHWMPLLGAHDGLRVCFGHFGEGLNLTERELPQSSWTQQIVDLMRQFPGRVFADISYHTEPMLLKRASLLANYLNNLRRLLDDPAVRGQLLWGTDYWLVRMRLEDLNYIRFYTKPGRLHPDEFDLLARDNPARWLGLPDAAGSMGRNIQGYVDYLKAAQARNDLDLSEAGGWLAPFGIARPS